MLLLTLYLRRSRLSLVLAIALGVVSGLTTAALLGVVNHVLAGRAFPAWTIAWFAGLCLLRLASGVGAHVLLIRLSQQAVADMRLDLCRRIAGAPLAEVERLGTHRLTSCFTDDVMNVANAVVNLPYFFVNIVVLLGCLAYLGWMSAGLLLAVGVGLGIGVLTYLGPVLWATRALRTAREHQDALFKHYGGVVGGVKELKLHAQRREALLGRVLHGAADLTRRHNVRGITIYATAANWNRLLFFVYVGLMLFVLPAYGVQPAVLAGYVVVVLYMMAPLEAIQNTLPHLAKADVALRRFQALGAELAAEAAEPLNSPSLPAGAKLRSWQRIELRGVTHRYQADREDEGFVLGPVDAVFARGEIVYLTGGNGSGKTTLVKLITGLYAPDQGRILVDGVEVTASLRPAYRELHSAVFSDFHLFDELFGLELGGLDGRAQRYLHLLGLDHKLAIERGRLSTTKLSQGQRKRLALLTAILEDRDFYVLDEWAADQDPAFRELFYTEIVPSLRDRGKTVLVVTHDDRYFHLADRQLRLDCGRLTCVAGPLATKPLQTDRWQTATVSPER